MTTTTSRPYYLLPRLSAHIDTDIGLNASVVMSALMTDMNKAEATRLLGITYKTTHELAKKHDGWTPPSSAYHIPLYFVPGLTLMETTIFSVIAKTAKDQTTALTMSELGKLLGRSTNSVCTAITKLKTLDLIELIAVDYSYKKVYAPKV